MRIASVRSLPNSCSTSRLLPFLRTSHMTDHRAWAPVMRYSVILRGPSGECLLVRITRIMTMRNHRVKSSTCGDIKCVVRAAFNLMMERGQIGEYHCRVASASAQASQEGARV